MPRKEPNPNQGAFLLPGAYGHEIIAAEHCQFPQPASGQEQTRGQAHPEGYDLSVSIVDRNREISRALAMLGIIARTAPAEGIEGKPAVRQSLERSYGSDYDIKANQMLATNQRVQVAFSDLFRKIWRLDKAGEANPENKQIKRMYAEDEQDFVTRFSKSAGMTTERARKNRDDYRKKLRRQETVYKSHNLGVWPTKTSRKTRR